MANEMDKASHEYMDPDAGPDGLTSLQELCGNVFEGDEAATALALGREEEQISAILSGDDYMDEDLAIKANALLEART